MVAVTAVLPSVIRGTHEGVSWDRKVSARPRCEVEEARETEDRDQRCADVRVRRGVHGRCPCVGVAVSGGANSGGSSTGLAGSCGIGSMALLPLALLVVCMHSARLKI